MLLVVGLLGPVAQDAHAGKKRVVVMPFAGPSGAKVRAGVIRRLRRRARLVSPRTYQNAAEKLGVSGRSPGGMAKICSRLQVSAIIRGAVRRKRRRYRVAVTVYGGMSGMALGRRTVTVRGKRRLKRAGGVLGRKAAELVEQGGYNEAAPAPAVKPAPASPAPVAQKQKRRRGDDNDDDDDDDDDDEDDDKDDDKEKDESSGSTGSYDGLVAVEAGLGVASRSFSLETSDVDKNRKYGGALYPEFMVGLQAYPMLLLDRGFLSGFGLGVSYSRHLAISTSQKESGADVDTASSELLINLRYRWLIGDKVGGTTVYGFVGYGVRSFELGANPTLTTFDYQFFQFALGGRLPLLGSLLAAELEASVRPVLKVGADAVNAFGKKTGAFGWSARAGVSGMLPFGLLYFARFEIIGFSSDFEGLSSTVEDVDIDIASSGSDTFIRFWLGAGYTL